ncbi:MAG: nuclear transport factor 2 family protein [Microcella sp.]|uniref:nuclear transport factor 2 family protein n=1 Tax=Microcella sp. TaxID=1913979 RepID=UPI002723C0C9|nr:nuclear transport factor 2 family protein [Microcella sp.]MDO8338968.1 nuclear transport factor 2 family protein [Microcella sp.]
MSATAAPDEAVVAAVLAAADAIVDDFGHHRTEAYFAGFAEDATFVFHTADRRLESRAEYEALWAQWEREDGFRVHACRSSDQRVQLLGDTAIFTHSVDSRIELGGSVDEVTERETIVFALRDGRWIAVHEHLSPRG